MRRFVCYAVNLGLFVAACQPSVTVTPAPASPTPPPDPLQSAWDDRSLFQAGLVKSARPVLDEVEGASVYHLEYEIAPDLIHVIGRVAVYYTNQEEVPLKDIRFRLFPNILGGDMHVPEVAVAGRSVTPNYGLDDSLLTVPLPTSLPPGGSVILAMKFLVEVPDSVELNYGVLASADGVLTLAHAYPVIPVFNDEGWNAELPPQAGDLTFADMSFFIVQVTAPRDLTLVAVGREVDRRESGGNQIVTYAAGPVRDFYVVAGSDLSLTTGELRETRVNFFAPASHQSGARAGVAIAARALEDFSARFAAYPYTELDVVGTPTLALGIEYPGMIAITDRLLDPDEINFEGTVAHEVAHQWFYNLVGSDQLDDPWLDESLTQFATLEYFTDEYGSGGGRGFRDSLYRRWDRVDRAPIPIGLPVASYEGREYGAIVYGRGALFFDALREKMGQQTFDAFLRDYTATYSWGIATPEGLKELAEKHCSCNLTPMYKEWVYP